MIDLQKERLKVALKHYQFTPDGTKFIWDEPAKPAFKKNKGLIIEYTAVR